MSCILTTEERSRLEKLVGMLGSPNDGERANAAAFIKRMADGKRVTIVELLMKSMTQGERPSSGYSAHRNSYSEQPYNQSGSEWKSKLKAALDAHKAGPNFMTDWEAGFAEDILSRAPLSTSAKQQAVIDRIVEKHARLKRAQADFG